MDDRVRATLGFLEQLTLEPARVGPPEREPLLTSGVTETEIEDAVHICAAFTILNKLADAFAWELLPDDVYASRAAASLERGYVVPDEVVGVPTD